MKLYFASIFLLFSTILLAQRQKTKDSILIKNIKVFNTNYKEFEIFENKIYAVTNGDSLVLINIKNSKVEFLDNNVVSIVKNSNNKIFLIKNNGDVFRQNHNSKFIKVTSLTANKFYTIKVDNNDEVVVFSDKAIHYKNQEFIPNLESPFYRKSGRRKRSDFLIPTDYLFVDKQNYMWFAYNAGEWGGDVCFFDLNKKKFIYDLNDNNGENFPYNNSYISSSIKGVVYKNEDIYVSSSSMHFYVSGAFYRLKKTNSKFEFCYNDNILENKIISIDTLKLNHPELSHYTEEKWKNFQKLTRTYQEFLGPINFNKFDMSLYYYSNLGFFKLFEKDDCDFSKEFYFKPEIAWSYGLPDAVGYQMNISKFEFISKNELVFLTSNNGIGFYDGEEVKYFK